MMQKQKITEITNNLLIVHKGLIVIRHFASRHSKQQLIFCGFLADALHRLPMISFETPTEQRKYWRWVRSLDKEVPPAFRRIFKQVYGGSGLFTTAGILRRFEALRQPDELQTLLEAVSKPETVQLPPDDRLKALLYMLKNSFVCNRTICFQPDISDRDTVLLACLTAAIFDVPSLIFDWSPDAQSRFITRLILPFDAVNPFYAAHVDYILDTWR